LSRLKDASVIETARRKNKMAFRDMSKWTRERQIEEAGRNKKPGYFQNAARIYQDIGMQEEYKIACLACGIDCFEQGLYGWAIEYFEESGNPDWARSTEKWIAEQIGKAAPKGCAIKDAVISNLISRKPIRPCDVHLDGLVRFN